MSVVSSAPSHLSIDTNFLELMADSALGDFESVETACAEFLSSTEPESADSDDDGDFSAVNGNGVCEFTHIVT